VGSSEQVADPAKRKLGRRLRAPEWLRKPEIGEDGSMSLADHLREIRYRLLVSVFFIIVCALFSFIFNRQLLAIATFPVTRAVEIYNGRNPNALVQLTTEGVLGSFTVWMRLGAVAGLLLSCPIWLYQIWAFIAPGLLAKEKKAALRFLGPAIPLFLTGVGVGYWICPQGFAVMFQFNPPGVVNLVNLGDYLVLELRLLLVFGVAFLLPVILLTLNKFGILSGEAMGKARNYAIFGCFVFAAVATPGGDPVSMLALSVPMAGMYVMSEVLAKRNDKKRGLGGANDEVVIGEPEIGETKIGEPNIGSADIAVEFEEPNIEVNIGDSK